MAGNIRSLTLRGVWSTPQASSVSPRGARVVRFAPPRRRVSLSVKKVKPILLEEVQENLSFAAASRENVDNSEFLPVRESQQECPHRCMKDSYQEVIIPLSKSWKEREKYVSFLGGIRFGRILEDLDLCAWWITHIHNQEPDSKKILKSRLNTVTALVDRIDMYETKMSIATDKDVKVAGHVTWVGKSSMEVTMNVLQEKDGQTHKQLTARFLMVARDPRTDMAAMVNRLRPEGELERSLQQQGEANKTRRVEEASKSLLKTVPSQEESDTVHKLFLNTVDVKSGIFTLEALPPNTVWMKDTLLKNVILCHPEAKNAYQKVFGGWLMRQAFEIAWANAALYAKGKPNIKIVDDIVFRKPVEIGSIFLLSAKIVCTQGSILQVKVHASVTDPCTGNIETTNSFYFTFDSGNKDLPRVIPYTYAESMMYLDGLRHLKH